MACVLRRLVVVVTAILSASFVQAAAPEPVAPDPVEHAEAVLVVVDPDGVETTYTPADLEALGMYRMVTTTPWRPEAAAFEGALLVDLLTRHGLENVSALRVTAENEFQTTLEKAVWEASPFILATRVDGRPHQRRARGPIQFVVSMDDYDGSDVIAETHLVWMAARIEPMPE